MYNVAQAEINTAEMFSSFRTFLDLRDGKSEQTIKTYTNAIKQFVMYLSAHGINNPTPDDLGQYRKWLQGRNIKPATINLYFSALRRFFAWTDSAGIYPNIAQNIKTGQHIDRKHNKAYLTISQLAAVLNSIDRTNEKGARDYAMFLLMGTTGIRAVETSRANIGDLDTDGGETVLYIQGKGHDEKKDAVILSPLVESALREYIAMRSERTTDAPLFASISNRNHGRRIDSKSISRTAKHLLNNNGFISARYTAHSFRHTALTNALLNGESLQNVQRQARHKSSSTTEIYLHDIEQITNTCTATVSNALEQCL